MLRVVGGAPAGVGSAGQGGRHLVATAAVRRNGRSADVNQTPCGMMRARNEPSHMCQMHRQSLTAYGQPLCETVVECPSPRGSEVLVRIERCGVCHSDLHLQDGYFSLGGDKKLDVSAGRTCLSRSVMRSPA